MSWHVDVHEALSRGGIHFDSVHGVDACLQA